MQYHVIPCNNIMTRHPKYTFLSLTLVHNIDLGRCHSYIWPKSPNMALFWAINKFFGIIIKFLWYHHDWTPKNTFLCWQHCTVGVWASTRARFWHKSPKMSHFWVNKSVFGPKIHFLVSPCKCLGTIMTGHQKDTFFVLTTLHNRHLGRHQDPFLVQKSKFFYATPI